MGKILLSIGLIVALSADTSVDDAEPTRITASLSGAVEVADVKILREKLSKVPGIKFNADDIKPGEEPEFRSSRFTIEIADLAVVDVGEIGKVTAAAGTVHKREHSPGLFLLLPWTPSKKAEKDLQSALISVKGVDAKSIFSSDLHVWVKIDGSGEGKLSAIRKALEDAGVDILVQTPGRNEQLTAAAWKALEKGNFLEAVSNADKCIASFEASAEKRQNQLKSAGANVPNGVVTESEKKSVHKNGLLNDVATSYFIKGKAFEALNEKDAAIAAYEAAATLTFARTWDPEGPWFWSPAEGAAERLETLR